MAIKLKFIKHVIDDKDEGHEVILSSPLAGDLTIGVIARSMANNWAYFGGTHWQLTLGLTHAQLLQIANKIKELTDTEALINSATDNSYDGLGDQAHHGND